MLDRLQFNLPLGFIQACIGFSVAFIILSEFRLKAFSALSYDPASMKPFGLYVLDIRDRSFLVQLLPKQ
jgi:hypothetical protein